MTREKVKEELLFHFGSLMLLWGLSDYVYLRVSSLEGKNTWTVRELFEAVRDDKDCEFGNFIDICIEAKKEMANGKD